MQPETLRVVIVESEPGRAARLQARLRSATGTPVVLTRAADPSEAAGIAPDADVALVSPNRGQDLLELVRALASHLPGVPVLAVDELADGADASALLRGGIQGHLPWHCALCPQVPLLRATLQWTAERGRLLRRLRALRERSEHLALHDPLTGLPNLRLFRERLRQLIALSRRHHRGFAVALLDLDRFKRINDSLGHEAGDALLVETAARLRTGVREGDTVARLGGDEFVLLLEEIRSEREAGAVARKLLRGLSLPLVLEGRQLACSASLGLGLFPAHGTDARALLRRADAAMYRAKARGGNGYCFFTPRMEDEQGAP